MMLKLSNNSKIMQKIIIYKKLPRIDFETEIDWLG